MRRFLAFAGKTIVVHTVTYWVVGAAAYWLLTRQFYEGAGAVFEPFVRTRTHPELWAFVVRWQLVGQVARGLLMAGALYPFLGVLVSWPYWKRFLSIASVYLVFGFWAAAVGACGTIEGLIYLRPEFTVRVHLMVQPEIVVQGLALGAWLARWMVRRTQAAT